MTTVQDLAPIAPASKGGATKDRRGSWLPTTSMITTRLMELRRRRGLMIAIIVITVGLPSLFLGIRLILHATDPSHYGPAGGEDIFTNITAGVLYVFGFIMAATLGATAGSSDLTDGMFRHLVVTGRSRLALYFARIPAGLAIILTAVAAGFAIVCLVSSLAAPTTISYNGVSIPAGLTQQEFVAWSVQHADEVVCGPFNFRGPLPNIPCEQNGSTAPTYAPGSNPPPGTPTQAQVQTIAAEIGTQNYATYQQLYLSPPVTLMVGSGLWLLLEATVGFIVGLGLGSLLGQRTVTVIVMIVLEIVLTPLLLTARIPYLLNAQRAVLGIAMAHLEPNGLTRVFGSGGGPNARSNLVPEATFVAVLVIIAWLVVWTALGAWRMVKRDA